MYAVEKKNLQWHNSFFNLFLGFWKKKEEKLIIYIYIPLNGSSYFRFVATNVNPLLLDPAYL